MIMWAPPVLILPEPKLPKYLRRRPSTYFGYRISPRILRWTGRNKKEIEIKEEIDR